MAGRGGNAHRTCLAQVQAAKACLKEQWQCVCSMTGLIEGLDPKLCDSSLCSQRSFYSAQINQTEHPECPNVLRLLVRSRVIFTTVDEMLDLCSHCGIRRRKPKRLAKQLLNPCRPTKVVCGCATYNIQEMHSRLTARYLMFPDFCLRYIYIHI